MWKCLACESQVDSSNPSWLVKDYEFNIGPEVKYFRCLNCESISQFPAPDSKQLTSWYPKYYFGRGAAGLFRKILQKILLSRRAKQASKALVSIHQNRILDFGCGDGAFLGTVKAQRSDLEVYGFDKMFGLYPPAFKGLSFQAVTDMGTSELKNKMGLVTMHHVIEHLAASDSLSDITRVLAPGGLLIGETPNATSGELKMFKKFWGGFHSPRHTVIFSAKGLKGYLERAGLKVDSIEGGFHPGQAGISIAAYLGLKEPRFSGAVLAPFSFVLREKGNVLRFVARKVH